MGRWIPDPPPAGGNLPRGNPGRRPPSPRPGADSCCPMVAAVRSVRTGRYRLARRYFVLSVRLMAGRVLA